MGDTGETMELSDILNSLSEESNAGSFDKTAADTSHDALSSAIDRALSSGLEKTASETITAQNPSSDLLKMASKIADAEDAAIVKEAELYGAAIADGFLARMGHAEGQIKEASYQDSVKLAYDQGYADTMQMLQGQQQQMQKVAHEEAVQGEMLKQAAFEQGYNDMLKEAAFEEGYNDVVKEAADLEKTAQAYEEYGFNYGNSILASI